MARNKRFMLTALVAVATFASATPARGAAGPITDIGDVIVPSIFTSYVQQLTAEKSAIIASGAMVLDPQATNLLSGAGKSFNMPSFRDLDNDEENVSDDDADDDFTGGTNNAVPKRIKTLQEIGVRLSRNQSWSSADIVTDLIAEDPMDAIANRVAAYWTRRLQNAFVNTMKGVFAMNAAAPINGSLHIANDMTHDIKGASYVAGVTDFSGSALVSAAVTMGDSMDDLTLMIVHSIVYARMLKNNLIDFVFESDVNPRVATFMGRRIVVDDGMPNTAGVFESWLFGSGVVAFGQGSPEVPTETERKPGSGKGGGSSILYNRTEWLIHPRGHAYVGANVAAGGPTNVNLAAAASWIRAFPERKQIKIARLITREF
jgi:hypothetical protein